MTETRPRLDVLVVDDDPAIRASFRDVLEHAGHRVKESPTGGDALESLGESPVDVVLLDLGMPGMSGLDVLERVGELAPDTAVIVVTGEATVQNAHRAGQRGAFDFIEKPPDRQQLLDIIDEAARVTRLRRAAHAVVAPAPAAGGTGLGETLGMLGHSPAIESLREHVRRIAPSQGRVLISGENGAGKELVAHAIHLL